MRKMITTFIALFVLITTQAGELFVKINSNGSYYATFDHQAVYNNSGIFRFFEVSGAQNLLIIRHQSTQQVVANIALQIPFNQKWVGEINALGQFQLLTTEHLSYISWYAQQNPFVHQTYNFTCEPTLFPGGMNNFHVLTEKDYQNFLVHLDKDAFDSGKITTAKNFVKKTRMSSEQIAGIAKKFTFDDNRLIWAKFAYDFCYDPANFHKLDDQFTFFSNRDALKKYVSSKYP